METESPYNLKKLPTEKSERISNFDRLVKLAALGVAAAGLIYGISSLFFHAENIPAPKK